MRVLVCGDRNWTNYNVILSRLDKLPQGTLIIEGEARGADSYARIAAIELGYEYLAFPADWKKYGRAAGPIRNKQMLFEGQPNLIIAFHNNIEESKGTKNMVKLGRLYEIPIEIRNEQGEYKWPA